MNLESVYTAPCNVFFYWSYRCCYVLRPLVAVCAVPSNCVFALRSPMDFLYFSRRWYLHNAPSGGDFVLLFLRVFLCNASSKLYIYIVPFNWYFMYWSHKWLFLMFPFIAICVLFLATLYLCNLYVYTSPHIPAFVCYL